MPLLLRWVLFAVIVLVIASIRAPTIVSVLAIIAAVYWLLIRRSKRAQPKMDVNNTVPPRAVDIGKWINTSFVIGMAPIVLMAVTLIPEVPVTRIRGEYLDFWRIVRVAGSDPSDFGILYGGLPGMAQQLLAEMRIIFACSLLVAIDPWTLRRRVNQKGKLTGLALIPLLSALGAIVGVVAVFIALVTLDGFDPGPSYFVMLLTGLDLLVYVGVQVYVSRVAAKTTL